MNLLMCALCLSALLVQGAEPIVPDKPIHPFASGDLSAFESWLKDTQHQDPTSVFTLSNGVLRISGESAGYLATKASYRNYRVAVEYKWGTHRTNKSPYVRNTGLLLHATGPHGVARGVWMQSLEVQLAQGCEGDFIVIRPEENPIVNITCLTRLAEDKRTRWDPDGTPTRYSGKQFWWKNHQPFFKELLDTRGQNDTASPVGQWTSVACECRGDRVSVFINDIKVNEAYNVSPQGGRILLQNESYEVFFRNLTIEPLDSKP